MKKLRLLLAIILIFSGLLFIFSNDNGKAETTDDKLSNIGYSKEQIETIKNKLSIENIDYLLTLSYDETYIKIMENENFKNEKLKSYIDYQKNNQAPTDDTILLVNADINIEYNEKLAALISEKYYKENNFDRYYNYLLDNPDLSTTEVVTNINSNLDYDYYTTDYLTDLKKDNLLIVNKYYKLESDYVPSDLVHITSTYGGNGQYIKVEAFEEYKRMHTDMKVLGLNLLVKSSYRSYTYQTNLYNNYVARDGRANADKYSARPGYSEHQTGLAIDVGTPTTSDLGDFLYTNEYEWMMQNAHKYGFILRYPEDSIHITGYMYEPWHFRYVGVEAATYIKENNLTYEEYYEYFVK